ncbi:hypothetical protein PISMIDRAFT_677054 [Pisolithus microcarpus 441]|uniref:GS catalytic domain-containing protein n=1 Tax=Pisolithus microcarpus 441 TaxID=765257 RepID=A0A0C9Y1P3_9AGAM|nr:hypothetical protein BKA83DRAFT_677054 [Pisolithus microcarpus]KIK11116.1 hypothetical protein PISMIDRAFT_690576 [Pisolithus microcarpus 441]KIK25742.1 hypothetical protein PISMIDRAFT_677054 [Pisolithus microcarpus 441]
MGPLPPLEAADALVHTCETIYNIASKHGMHATFAPRLYTDSCATGAYAQISVHSNYRTLTTVPSIIRPLSPLTNLGA